jgi:hypothetical protein
VSDENILGGCSFRDATAFIIIEEEDTTPVPALRRALQGRTARENELAGEKKSSHRHGLQTTVTNVTLTLDLDGRRTDTGVGFFDHMLTLPPGTASST